MPAPNLDQKILQSILHYDPTTGIFVWRIRQDCPKTWNTRYAGKVAGYEWKASRNVTYRCIRIFDWPFLAHRLAYLYMTGEWPDETVDHRDLDGLNNTWDNLRPATKSQNAANTPVLSTNTSGLKGVSRQSGTRRYRATIRINGRQQWLGSFATKEEAAAAYAAAAKAKSGEFARVK